MTSIEHAGRTITDALVAFDVRWEGDLGGAGTVVWTMVVSDGASEVRLSHERRGGEVAVQYVVDGATGRRQEVPEDADVEDDGITARFPADVVGVAVEWPVWTAVITVDGEDVAHRVVPVT